jgi:hypothetical protein
MIRPTKRSQNWAHCTAAKRLLIAIAPASAQTSEEKRTGHSIGSERASDA